MAMHLFMSSLVLSSLRSLNAAILREIISDTKGRILTVSLSLNGLFSASLIRRSHISFSPILKSFLFNISSSKRYILHERSLGAAFPYELSIERHRGYSLPSSRLSLRRKNTPERPLNTYFFVLIIKPPH